MTTIFSPFSINKTFCWFLRQPLRYRNPPTIFLLLEGGDCHVQSFFDMYVRIFSDVVDEHVILNPFDSFFSCHVIPSKSAIARKMG